jgi:transposase
MKAFSIDLRERATAAYDAQEGTQQQIADRFCVSLEWVRKILRQRRDTGSIAPKPHGGGRAPAFDQAAAARLRKAVAEGNDATLKELAQAAGVPCSPSVVHRALKALGITRKKSPGGRPSRSAPG